MKEEMHIPDSALQQYALEGQTSDPLAEAHMRHCALCTARMEFYRNMARTVAGLPTHQFDFDIAAAVLAKIPPKRSKRPVLAVLFTLAAITGVLPAVLIPWYMLPGFKEVVVNAELPIAGILLACAGLFAYLTMTFRLDYLSKIKMLKNAAFLQQTGASGVYSPNDSKT